MGCDTFAQEYLEILKGENVDASCVKIQNDKHSGVAHITVTENGTFLHSTKIFETCCKFDETVPSSFRRRFVISRDPFCLKQTFAGENNIVIVLGANESFSPEDVDSVADMIASANVLLCQFEIPLKTTLRALKLHRGRSFSGSLTFLFYVYMICMFHENQCQWFSSTM